MKIQSVSSLPAAPRFLRRRLLSALVLPLAVAGWVLAPAQAQTSAVPGLISYQGKVSNANGTLVGAGTPVNRTVIFRIWSHAGNSTINDLVYSEQQTVTVSEGEFSVLIGQGTAVSGTPLGYSEAAKGTPTVTINSLAVFGGATRFLGVTIDDGTVAADPEISPRQQLVSSAFAMRAKYAESLGANGANSLVALDNGNVGVGTASPGVRLDVVGSARAGGAGNASFVLANSAGTTVGTFGAPAGVGAFSSDAAANDVVIRADGGGKLLLQTGTGASAIMIDSANRVGIGTTTPSAKLHVGGAIAASAFTTTHSQGAYLEWSKAGTGATSLLNQKGLGTGGIIFGEVDTADTVTERMRIGPSGNVGIANASPSALLHIGTGFNGGPGGLLINTGWISQSNPGENRPFEVQLRGNTAMVVNTDGRVGIGTSAPTAQLQVTTNDTTNTAFIYNAGGGSGTQPALRVRVEAGSGARNVIQAESPLGMVFMARDDLRIGMGGITNPTQATVAIGGSGVSQTGLVGAYINSGTAASAVTHGTHGVSLYASGTIWCGNTVIATSDARTKLIQGLSNGAADLRTLLGIEITDFKYKDVIGKGDSTSKKVIAQQVEKVFPQAVGRRTEAVPDIYSAATYRDGWVELANTLKPGERVRLIDDKVEGVYEVLESKPDGFRTSFVPSADKVFVYGREVSDFRTVDYDAISMLNVSATQELARENAALKARVAELEGRDRDYAAKFAALEKMIQSTATAMAKPAAARAAASEQQ